MEVEFTVKQTTQLSDEAVRSAAESLVNSFPALFCETHEFESAAGDFVDVSEYRNTALAERVAAVAVAAYRHHTSQNPTLGVIPR